MEAGNYGTGRAPGRQGIARRLTTETKQAFKTTEFWVFLAFLLAVLIAGTVDNSEGSEFGANDVWLYGTIVTAAYLISRGLAKAGSRDPYWDNPNATSDDSIGERVKAAAQVLTDGPASTDSQSTHASGRSGGSAA